MCHLQSTCQLRCVKKAQDLNTVTVTVIMTRLFVSSLQRNMSPVTRVAPRTPFCKKTRVCTSYSARRVTPAAPSLASRPASRLSQERELSFVPKPTNGNAGALLLLLFAPSYHPSTLPSVKPTTIGEPLIAHCCPELTTSNLGKYLTVIGSWTSWVSCGGGERVFDVFFFGGPGAGRRRGC